MRSSFILNVFSAAAGAEKEEIPDIFNASRRNHPLKEFRLSPWMEGSEHMGQKERKVGGGNTKNGCKIIPDS